MLQLKIKNIASQEITHQADFKTQEEVDSFILKVQSSKNQDWGKLERLKIKSEASAEEIAEAIETIPAVMDGEEEVSPEMIKLPKTYEIIVTDISSQIAQEAINKQAKDLLANSDWKVLRHKDQVDLGVPTSMTEQEYQDLLQARQAARDSIVE